jgi:glutamate racemase
MTGPVIVFDSGLGGLTVLAALARARVRLDCLYVADDAGFPYGEYGDEELAMRVVGIISGLIGAHAPAVAVIACNSASTLVLARLRARFAIGFVGTVPAIKPAALSTRSGLISVLATPGTVRRDYTRALIAEHAAGVSVTLVGARDLARIAEERAAGEMVDRDAVAAEIAPAFVERGGARTDTVVLACTHFPLLIDELRAAAPWPVAWIDPAPAIARRVCDLLSPAPGSLTHRFLATSGARIDDRAGRILDRLIDSAPAGG